MAVSINGTTGITTPGIDADSGTMGTLTAAVTASPLIVGGDNISASNSLGFRNRIINGDMRIDQRNSGASVTVGFGQPYTLDRWQMFASQASKLSIQQNAGSVTPPAGFSNYLGITSLSAYSPLFFLDYFSLRQTIEGFNTSDFGWGTADAQPVTLSFRVRSSLTGTFSGSISGALPTRSYVFSYTIDAPNTWETKTITIPGDTETDTETSGTWATDNSDGVTVSFSIGAAALTRAAGSWDGGLSVAVPEQVSLLATNGATWYITGVQLEAGSVATPFERRDYGRELIMCQRYFYQQVNYMGQSAPYSSEATGANGFSNGSFSIAYRVTRPHPVEMRTTPTVTYANIDIWDGTQRTATSIANNNSSKYVRSVDWNVNGTLAGAGRIATEFMMPSGYIACSAEL